MRFVPYLLGLSLGCGLLACSSNPSTTTTIVRPELVAVSPGDFLGTVRCGETAGTAWSYVATLFDVTPTVDAGVPSPGFQLPSSVPTLCTQPVTFSFVVTNHYYLARVDAYDQAPEALTPLSPGARLQLDSNGARVAPMWAATCGGYPPSPDPDAGIDFGIGAAGASDGDPPGVVSHSSITQTPHDCGAGLQRTQD